MMKKIVTGIMALLLCVLLVLPCTAAQPYQISVSGYEAVVGKNVIVEIRLENNIADAINASFSLNFNPQVLEIVKTSDAYQITGGTVFGDAFVMAAAGNNTDGYANYGGTASSGQNLSVGVIYTVEFKVLQAADPEFEFTVHSLSLAKGDREAVYPQLASEIEVKLPEIKIVTQQIMIDAPKSTTLTVGQILPLTVQVSPAGAQAPVWSSSDEKVLTVDSQTGLVTAVAEGDAKVTVTSGEKTDTISLTVKGPSPLANTGDSSPILMLIGVALLSLTGVIVIVSCKKRILFNS